MRRDGRDAARLKDQPSYPSRRRTAALLIVQMEDVRRVSQSERRTRTHARPSRPLCINAHTAGGRLRDGTANWTLSSNVSEQERHLK